MLCVNVQYIQCVVFMSSIYSVLSESPVYTVFCVDVQYTYIVLCVDVQYIQCSVLMSSIYSVLC